MNYFPACAPESKGGDCVVLFDSMPNAWGTPSEALC